MAFHIDSMEYTAFVDWQSRNGNKAELRIIDLMTRVIKEIFGMNWDTHWQTISHNEMRLSTVRSVKKG